MRRINDLPIRSKFILLFLLGVLLPIVIIAVTTAVTTWGAVNIESWLAVDDKQHMGLGQRCAGRVHARQLIELCAIVQCWQIGRSAARRGAGGASRAGRVACATRARLGAITRWQAPIGRDAHAGAFRGGGYGAGLAAARRADRCAGLIDGGLAGQLGLGHAGHAKPQGGKGQPAQ